MANCDIQFEEQKIQSNLKFIFNDDNCQPLLPGMENDKLNNQIIQTMDCDEDESILSMDVDIEFNNTLSSQNTRMQIALDIVVQLVLPLFNGVSKGWQGISGYRMLKALRSIRASRQMFTDLLAFAANSISMSLSSVQGQRRIDSLLKMMKLKKESRNALENQTSRISLVQEGPPEKCVTLNVLSEPPTGTPIRADVIFIHGLHGSLVNTWKQGMWNRDSKTVPFERPPKPPVRPPKRPRYTRSMVIQPPHRSKRARISIRNSTIQQQQQESRASSGELLTPTNPDFLSFTYNNDDQVMDLNENDITIPTFRMRMEDDGTFESRNIFEGNASGSQPENYSKCWPGDWLPVDCPGVRVIALNYTTDPYLWRPAWIRKRNRTSLVVRSREMADLLMEIGVGVGHPIVWVGHSKGGIFIKQIIVDAWESGKVSTAPLWQSSRGALFYSVPHRGSSLADFNLPLLRQSVELIEIKKNCPGVLELHRRFVALYHSGLLKIQIFSFVETAMTLMSVLYLRIVGIDSADPGIGEVCGVHLDHREICKPRNKNCILYTQLTKMINEIS